LINSDHQPHLTHRNTSLRQREFLPFRAVVQIPKLPTSSGDILEYETFWRQFEGTLHHRKDFNIITNESLLLINVRPSRLRTMKHHAQKELLRLHDEINAYLLEICALGRGIDTNIATCIANFQVMLPVLIDMLLR
ncbi:hypothetical protein T06_5029, partial [Trichinella sp. T6]